VTAPTSDRYGKDYYSREFGLDELRRFNMHWWSVRYYAKLADRLLRQRSGRRVFELGCAHGYTLSWLESKYETYGIDLSDYAIERSKTIAPRSKTFAADIAAPLPSEISPSTCWSICPIPPRHSNAWPGCWLRAGRCCTRCPTQPRPGGDSRVTLGSR
jgi:SAM-dependent methyltransferase